MYELETLRDCFQVGQIKDVCPKCRAWADKQIGEIHSKTAPEVRRRIVERIGLKSKPSIWRRLFTRRPN